MVDASYPMGSMEPIYLPAFTLKQNQLIIKVGKY